MTEEVKPVPQEDTNPDVEEQKTDVQSTEEKPETPEVKEEPKKEERPVHTVPLSKFNEEREKAARKAREETSAEYEAKMEAMKAEYEEKLTKSSPEHEDVVKLAEEYGYSEKDAEFVAKIIEKRTPKIDTSKYDKILEEQEKQANFAKVQSEFEEKVLPLIQNDYPNVTPQHIKEVKDRITELAFTEGYNTYRIEDLYQVKKSEFEFKNGYGAEPSGGRSAEMVDFEQMSDEQEHELAKSDPQTYKKYLDYMASKQSRYLDM
jgi:transcriptional regulator with XRE-family HTH domain